MYSRAVMAVKNGVVGYGTGSRGLDVPPGDHGDGRGAHADLLAVPRGRFHHGVFHQQGELVDDVAFVVGGYQVGVVGVFLGSDPRKGEKKA
jgi:hypothetical protein